MRVIAVEKQPVTLLTSDLTNRKSQQAAYTGISASLVSLSLSVAQFGKASVLNSRVASSSNSAALQATATSAAVVGSYSFRPVRLAQSQRFTSAGYSDATTAAVGAGTISVKRGGFVDTDVSLDALNGGAGVARGKIRIIDRSGIAAVVDLSATQSIGDVVRAINENGVAAVTASLQGDSLVITDQSGQTTANLTIQEIGGGKTATDLGIAGSFNASQKIGSDIVKLGPDTKLSTLNDGLGVRRSGSQDDFRIALKDGTTVDVNISTTKTIQDVLTAINGDSENSGKVTAAISADGDKLVLTDNTGGGGTLSVSERNGSKAARDLGILGTEQAGGVLTGTRTLAGLGSVLVKNLNGGQGVATPGSIQLTDRSGATATVALSTAQSLSEVVTAINGAGLGIKAAINTQGHGLTISDTTGLSASNLIIADVGGGTSATDLHIAGDVALASIKTGDLHAAYINDNTALSGLNGGAGISAGQFKITDKSGTSTVLNISGTSYKTIGDVILGINAGAADVTASLNATGDGILLTDNSVGSGSLSVTDLLGGKTAADLHLRGTGTPTIDGAFVDKITIDADDTLNDVVQKIGAGSAPISASVFNTGGSEGYKLLVGTKQGGAAGRVVIDSGTTGLNLTQSQSGLDAVLQLSGNGSSPVVFSSSSNTFTSVVAGVSIDITAASASNVTVNVTENGDSLVAAINNFVTGYNSISSNLKDQTSFDSETTTAGLLQGDQVAVGLRSMLQDLAGRRYGGGSINNLTQIGLKLTGGQLTFDESVLRAKLASDPDGVKDFFGSTDTGVAAAVGKSIKSYVDAANGILFHKIDALDAQQTSLQSRIDDLNVLIESKRTRLANQFLLLEKTLATLKSQQNSLASLTSSSSSSNSSSSSSSS
ncbi:MAG: flagellar filament capping protein FliD [Planctomycetia bacterium]|nr:flagellar filament capping protein FliD [Planctomycetia bacterium]